MTAKQVLWAQPYGKGLALLMCLFGFLGLMSGWMLLEADFSDGWRTAARIQWALVLQTMLALNSAMCFTLVWLLWTRNRAALLLGALYVVLGVLSQAGMFWYVGRLGSQVDMLSLGLWLGEAIFWFCIVGYLYWLESRGVLR